MRPLEESIKKNEIRTSDFFFEFKINQGKAIKTLKAYPKISKLSWDEKHNVTCFASAVLKAFGLERIKKQGFAFKWNIWPKDLVKDIQELSLIYGCTSFLDHSWGISLTKDGEKQIIYVTEPYELSGSQFKVLAKLSDKWEIIIHGGSFSFHYPGRCVPIAFVKKKHISRNLMNMFKKVIGDDEVQFKKKGDKYVRVSPKRRFDDVLDFGY